MVSGDPFQLIFYYDSVEILKTNFTFCVKQWFYPHCAHSDKDVDLL